MFSSPVWHPLTGSRPRQAAFRRDNEPFRIRMKRLGDQQFAGFRPVSIGRVDQVHTEFDRASQNFERIVAVSRPTPNAFAGDAHRAKAEAIDREIAAQTCK